MRVIAFNEWRIKPTNRRCLIEIAIGRVSLLSLWWWKGGRIGATLLGFGFGVIP
jgi:hypothetical protein